MISLHDMFHTALHPTNVRVFACMTVHAEHCSQARMRSTSWEICNGTFGDHCDSIACLHTSLKPVHGAVQTPQMTLLSEKCVLCQCEVCKSLHVVAAMNNPYIIKPYAIHFQ